MKYFDFYFRYFIKRVSFTLEPFSLICEVRALGEFQFKLLLQTK
jgi:hypothetical protein